MNREIISFENYLLDEDVHILSAIKNEFERLYLEVRRKEQRIYSDGELAQLPFASNTNPHRNEWKIRAKSFLRFNKYLSTKKEKLNFLDLGCGNGWFCGQLSEFADHNYFCIDVNLMELKQGRNVFRSKRLKFIYADIFTAEFAPQSFDIITINAAIQYFPNLKLLLDRIKIILNKDGEIHIIDSPFYSDTEVEYARQRTLDYYSTIGFNEMANHYFHHKWSELSAHIFKVLYNPNLILNKIKRPLGFKNSLFPWVVIKK